MILSLLERCPLVRGSIKCLLPRICVLSRGRGVLTRECPLREGPLCTDIGPKAKEKKKQLRYTLETF